MNSNSLGASSFRAGVVVSLCVAVGLTVGACSDNSSSDMTAAISMKTDSAAGTSSSSGASSSFNKSDSSGSSSFSAATTLDADAAPEGDLTSSPKEAAPSNGAYLGVEDVRIGSHDGYDRIVFEFTGEGSPGYFIRYEDVPTQQGSGKTVSVKGASKLMVTLRGMGYPFDFQMEDFPSGPVRPTSTTSVEEVLGAGTYEGQTQYVIGLKGDNPAFKVFQLNNPNRLVIDFAAE